jgi:predicted RNA-binding protein YlxR (DUF448 family)
MEALAGGYTQILVMFAIVVVGYIASKLGYITKAGFTSINSFLIHIALPCMIIGSVAALDPATGGAQVPWFFAMAAVEYVLLFGITWLLNRILRTPEGEITLDTTGKKSGRGAYICKNPACLKKLRKNRRAEANLGVSIPEEVWDALEAALAEEK